MSRSLDGRIKGEKINKQLFEKYVNLYFNLDLESKLNYEDEIIIYNCSKFACNIIFVIEKKYPTNIWDSDILCGEYEYSQAISFDLHKESDYDYAYKCILDFFVFLHEHILCDILVTSDVFDDICYISDNDIWWSNRWLNRWK